MFTVRFLKMSYENKDIIITEIILLKHFKDHTRMKLCGQKRAQDLEVVFTAVCIGGGYSGIVAIRYRSLN